MKDTKERILLASLELFARYGYDAASVSRIAEAVGLTKGALYRHFEDKAAILQAILARMEADDAAFAGRFALPTGEALDSSMERAPSDGTRDSSAKRAPSAGTLDSSMERATSDGTRDSSTERAMSDGTLDSSMERATSNGTRDSSTERAPSDGTLDSSMERAAQGKTLAPSVETTKIAARVGRFEPPTDASPSTAAGASGRSADAAALVAFARAMFAYWTEDAFASAFRRMLTVSQYTSPEMRALYRQYLADGPLAYCEDILKAAGHADARLKALRLFAPMTFLYALYDGEANHAETLRLADAHFSSMARELCSGFTI
ncbi:MAG: helix-turn-helix domain-containing protein [Eubacteriales bacterium]|nr:helix-turn-helix domain-containing protein [Eubacteriales bacterium]